MRQYETMKSLRQVKVFAAVTLLMVIVLLVAYNFLWSEKPLISTPNSTTVIKQASCGLSDNSFCQTEGELRNYVQVNDFSDVLENQKPISVNCDGSNSPLEMYCQGGNTGLIIQLWQYRDPRGINYMTRNQYISYFAEFDSQYGPLKFISASMSGNTAQMNFTSKSTAGSYELMFSKLGSQWVISYPIVNP